MKKSYIKPEISVEKIEDEIIMLNTSHSDEDVYDNDPYKNITDNIDIFDDPLTPPPSPTGPYDDDGDD